MNKSIALVLVLAVIIILASSGIALSQTDIGYVKSARGEVYWQEKHGVPEIKVNADKLIGKKLVAGEVFRCGRKGVLVLLLYGREVTVREKMKQFPIPFAMPALPNKQQNRLNQQAEIAPAAKTASNDSSPALQPTAEEVRKLKGVVVKREPDSFTIAETTGGPTTTVLLTSSTEVKSYKRGAFRGSKEHGVSYILRGLRLELDGTRNSDGTITADKIRFDEQDLRTAQALKATLDPVERELNEKLAQQQAEQERLAGQIEENRALTEKAQAAADAAAEAARKAQDTADYANNRINGLDDFDPIKTVTVLFTTGSATLGPKAKAEIDNAAAWVKTQNTKGWVMAVIGYADTTGNSQRNIDLSERRANAVIYYIVSKYKMPLNRLVQPFGYGQLEPVAENKTREGRAKNRRVEIRLMVNKGIAGKVSGAPD